MLELLAKSLRFLTSWMTLLSSLSSVPPLPPRGPLPRSAPSGWGGLRFPSPCRRLMPSSKTAGKLPPLLLTPLRTAPVHQTSFQEGMGRGPGEEGKGGRGEEHPILPQHRASIWLCFDANVSLILPAAAARVGWGQVSEPRSPGPRTARPAPRPASKGGCPGLDRGGLCSDAGRFL